MRHVLKRVASAIRSRVGANNLRRAIASGKDLRIVLGATPRVFGRAVFGPGWVPTDIEYLDIVKSADWNRFFRPEAVKAMMAEHVLQYLPESEARTALALCHRFMAPGARFRIAVPDGLFPDPAYVEWVRPGGSGDAASEHRTLFDYRSLTRLLVQSGYEVHLLEYFDEEGVFHETPWRSEDGHIRRSRRFDPRNAGGTIRYTSLICDAVKPSV